MTTDVENVQAGIITPFPDGWQHRLDVVVSLHMPSSGTPPDQWSIGFRMLLDAVDWEQDSRPSDAETEAITFGLTARGHRHLRQLIPAAPALSMLEATSARWNTLGDDPRAYDPSLVPGQADLVLLLAGPDPQALARRADALVHAFGPTATESTTSTTSTATNADAFGFAEGAGNPHAVGANPPDSRAEPRPAFNAAWFVCASLPGVVAAGADDARATTPTETTSSRWRRRRSKGTAAVTDPVGTPAYTDPVRSTNFAVACRSGDTLLVWRKLEQDPTKFNREAGDDDSRARIVGRYRDGTAFAPPGPPKDSHVARARPDGARGLMLRRSSLYKVTDSSGDRTGLVFRCFQRDIAVGYEWVQRRLAVPGAIQGLADDDPLTGPRRRFVTALGGDYYLVPGHSRVKRWKDLFDQRNTPNA